MKTILFGTIIEEYSIKAKSDTNYLVCSVTNTNGFQKSSDTFDKQVFSENLSTYKKVFRGSFAYNPSRINVGSIGCQDIDDCVLVSPLYNIFSINTNITSPEFVSYFFKSGYVKNYIRQNTQGTVRSNFKMSEMSKLHFPNITIKEQNLLLNEFRYIESIISKDKAQLDLLDELIKSRFVEMFGQDLKGKSIRLGDLTEVITKGTTPTTLGFDFVDEGVNFVKVECITEQGKFIKEKMLHINEECNEKLKRSILKKDDILFSIAGAIGRTAIVTDDILPANINQALSIIRLKKDAGLNVEFLSQVLKTDLITEQIGKRVNGVAQMNVSLADISNLKIIRPTIDRQNDFAQFVQQVDKLKSSVQKHLTTMQELFDKKMDEYFN